MKITIKPVSNGLIVEAENEIKVYVDKNANEGKFAILDVLQDFGYKAARDGYSEAAKDLSPTLDKIEIEFLVKARAL